MNKSIKKIIQNKVTKQIFAGLNIVTEVAKNLPNKLDSRLTAGIKTVSILNLVKNQLVSGEDSVYSFIRKNDLVRVKSSIIPSLLASSIFQSIYHPEKIELGNKEHALRYGNENEALYLFLHTDATLNSAVYHTRNFPIEEMFSKICEASPQGLKLITNESRERSYIGKFELQPFSKNCFRFSNQFDKKLSRCSAAYNDNFKTKTILLKGPPGTGKTSFAANLGNKINGYFLSLDACHLENLYVQDLKIMCDYLNVKVLLIDDFERSKTDEALSKTFAFMEEMKTLHQVYVLIAVNSTKQLPAALLRSGRVDEVIEFELPDVNERKDMLNQKLHEINCNSLEIPESDIIKETEGFSHADMCNFLSRLENQSVSEAIDVLKKLRSLENNGE